MREKIVNSLQTIIEMLNDRNIHTGLSANDAHNILGDNMFSFDFLVDKVKIVYHLSKLKWSDLEERLQGDFLFIIIVKETLTSKVLDKIKDMNIQYQVFHLNELQFNITKHQLVPKHELVPQEKHKDILQSYNLVHVQQLPWIQQNDPVAKYFNLKKGDIVRITRPSPTSGEYVIYRCCV